MQCLQCHKENKTGRKFCSACGSALPLSCPSCGFENELDDQFCGGCGKAIVSNFLAPSASSQPAVNPKHWTPHHLAERILAEQTDITTRASTDGERKTITALFADVAGFTTLTQALDPEDTRQLIDPALHLMMEAVHHYDGYVAQSLGDGIFALFGAPLAHEDHAQRALYAALRMQEEMRHYADRLRLEKGTPLQIRVGINTGEVVLRSIRKGDLHVDYVPVGYSTNLASRMENLATPGSIIISHHTYKLIEGYFECKFLGEAQVKGIDQPVPIYEVLSAGPLRTRLQVAARRGLTRFVGRHSEMEQMQRAFAQAQTGQGQIVGVMGEPGLGKSRLFYEFVRTYCHTPQQTQSACLVLQAYAVSHGKVSPYLPVIELLKSYFQLQPQDDERTRREKIGGKVLMLNRSLEDTLPYLFALLGVTDTQAALQQMDPQIRRRRTVDALTRLFLSESLNQPLLLIFEDLHWIDSETQGFLDTLTESIPSTRILLLVNYRPEYRHAWEAKTSYLQLRLAPFGKAEAEEFLDVLLGAATVETLQATSRQRLNQLILDKTEGTPFFMEEIVQELVEQGVLIRDGVEAGLTPVPPLHSQPDLRIPTTVQGVLAARIDRLAPDEKAFLQQLAVIGREFPLSLVKEVIALPEDDLYRLLSALQHKEFLYERPAFPEVEYHFKHALTQEVAYNSVLVERRKPLHEQTARAIEQLYLDRLEEHYSTVAHHYSHSSNTEKAVTYLQKAAQYAARRSAHAEAIDHLTSAIQLVISLPDISAYPQRELDLQLALAASLQVTRGPSAPEVERAYTRARELLQHQEETPQLFAVLRGLWVLQHVRANLTAAREIGEQLRGIAERTHDAALLLEAHRALGSTLLWLGEFSSACTHLQRAMAYYDQQMHHALTLHGGADPGVACLCELARVLWFLGYPDRALQQSQAALTLAQSLTDPFSLS